MLVVSFFSWWYGRGWKQVFDAISPRLQGVLRAFSVAQLTKTLFAPWRRIISESGSSLADKMRAWGDNMFSRMVGFVVRFFVLLAAAVSYIVIGALTLIELIVWPLIPLTVPALVIIGLTA
jgi:hypothetical protein